MIGGIQIAENYSMDLLFKCITVGDGAVGKTALTLRFTQGFFAEDYKMTIGVDFYVKEVKIDTNKGPIRAKLQVWDVSGQERWNYARTMYYRNSLGAIVVFDLTRRITFENIPKWLNEIKENVKNPIPIMLVGNKKDLKNLREINENEAIEFANRINCEYIETSAKTGETVNDMFYRLAECVIGIE